MNESQMVIAKAMSERALQDNVRSMAKALGWLFYHTHDSRRSDPGFPDCTLVRRGVIVFVELKAERGKMTDAQREWRVAIQESDGNVFWYCWRPSDWLDGTVEAVLQRGTQHTR